MAKNTRISWTDSTFNPWIGCTKVGPGCDNCYAEALMDTRWHTVQWGSGQQRHRTSAANWRQPLLWERGHEAFALMYGRRRRVFCASLADVFDNEVPRQWRQDLFDLIIATPNIDWLLLTKRIGNAGKMLNEIAVCRGALLTANDEYRPPENVWIGATICNQEEADRDIQKLLAIPARVRFLSMEPLLEEVTIFSLDGPVDVPYGERAPIDWVIVGGESGHGARPMKAAWVENIKCQCEAADVAFFFKQWGGRIGKGGCLIDGGEVKQWPSVA